MYYIHIYLTQTRKNIGELIYPAANYWKLLPAKCDVIFRSPKCLCQSVCAPFSKKAHSVYATFNKIPKVCVPQCFPQHSQRYKTLQPPRSAK